MFERLWSVVKKLNTFGQTSILNFFGTPCRVFSLNRYHLFSLWRDLKRAFLLKRLQFIYLAETILRTLNIFLTLTQPTFMFTQKKPLSDIGNQRRTWFDHWVTRATIFNFTQTRPLSDISYQGRTWFDSKSTRATVFLGLTWTGSFFVWRRWRKLQKQWWFWLNLQRWLSFHLFRYLRISLSWFLIWVLLMLLLVIRTQLCCCRGVRWWKSAIGICSMSIASICSMSSTSIFGSMSVTSICSKVAESISSQIPEYFQLDNSATYWL